MDRLKGVEEGLNRVGVRALREGTRVAGQHTGRLTVLWRGAGAVWERKCGWE